MRRSGRRRQSVTQTERQLIDVLRACRDGREHDAVVCAINACDGVAWPPFLKAAEKASLFLARATLRLSERPSQVR